MNSEEPRGISGVARHDPDRVALVAGDRRITFAELDADANRVAHALTEVGVAAGDRVAVMMQNRPELFAVWNGAARCRSARTSGELPLVDGGGRLPGERLRRDRVGVRRC